MEAKLKIKDLNFPYVKGESYNQFFAYMRIKFGRNTSLFKRVADWDSYHTKKGINSKKKTLRTHRRGE